MTKQSAVLLLLLTMTLTMLAGCGGGSTALAPGSPLSASNVNLIFVVSPDLAYSAPGDVSQTTANLTNQGLQRSLLMATYLQQNVLGGANVTSIYTIEPTTHPQTANQYPDMAAIEYIQQFAMLNQLTMSYGPGTQVTAYSYPINASYSSASVPSGVVTPSPTTPCAACQGLDFNDVGGDNEALANDILKGGAPGYYVFSAPWETVRAIMANINVQNGYNLSVPSTYPGPNAVYAIAVNPASAPAGGSSVNLARYDADLSPTTAYPSLPAAPLTPTACNQQPAFSIAVTGGAADGAHVPAGVNKNETLYIIRHANAHPTPYFSDGNFVGSGQWRSLGLPAALQGKIHPTQVLSGDLSQIGPGTYSTAGNYYSTATPAMTPIPYAIANDLPYNLVSSFWIANPDGVTLAQDTSAYLFFTGPSTGQLKNVTALLAWSYAQIAPAVNDLIASYYPGGVVPAANQAPNWPSTDYDTIWAVKLDAVGNLTVDNSLCEGIDSALLPPTPPPF